MNLPILYLWMIGHFLSDYYFQSDKMAEMKYINKQVLFKHNAIYFMVMISVVLIIFDVRILLGSVFIGFTHAVIDQIVVAYREKNPEKRVQLYLIDQCMHLLIILITYLIIQNQINLQYIFEMGFSIATLLQWALMLIIIVNPISITIRILLEPYRPEAETKEGVENAGALVGILERLIVFLLLSVDQYAAIGLVLTAKSIARYNRISEDPVFSEYYLLGTLLSMLLVIAPFLAIF